MLFAKKETRQNAVRDGFNHGQDPDPSPNPDNDDDNNDDDDDNDVLVIGQVVMLQISWHKKGEGEDQDWNNEGQKNAIQNSYGPIVKMKSKKYQSEDIPLHQRGRDKYPAIYRK